MSSLQDATTVKLDIEQFNSLSTKSY